MRIKTSIRFVPVVLSGLLSANLSCGKIDKSNEKVKVNNEVSKCEIIEDTVELENMSFENNEILELQEESLKNIEHSYIVKALNNTKIYSYNEDNNKYEKFSLLIKGEVLNYIDVNEDGYIIVEYDGKHYFVKEEAVEVIECYGIYNSDKIPAIYSKNDILNIFEETEVVIATARVNVRAEASTSSEKLDQLKIGDALPLINVYDEWCEVNYYGRSAYVYKEYVKVKNAYYPKYEMLDMVYMTSNVPLIDVDTCEKIVNIPKREVAEVYAQTEDNYLVKYNGRVGYVSKEYAYSLGDKYVIIDISSQNLKVYVDDNLIIDTPIVTGKDSSPTYCGLFEVRTKEENVYWPEFKVEVKYWMPFNRGEGMHDASWRKKFGGDIFHKDGSHGCVNIPVDIMPIIFENVDIGTPVLVKK